MRALLESFDNKIKAITPEKKLQTHFACADIDYTQ